jgi:hypothetical protein
MTKGELTAGTITVLKTGLEDVVTAVKASLGETTK